jgi:hypothetical protein
MRAEHYTLSPPGGTLSLTGAPSIITKKMLISVLWKGGVFECGGETKLKSPCSSRLVGSLS